MHNPQLNADGELQHLLTLEGLPAEIIGRILDTAVPFVSIAERDGVAHLVGEPAERGLGVR